VTKVNINILKFLGGNELKSLNIYNSSNINHLFIAPNTLTTSIRIINNSNIKKITIEGAHTIFGKRYQLKQFSIGDRSEPVDKTFESSTNPRIGELNLSSVKIKDLCIRNTTFTKELRISKRANYEIKTIDNLKFKNIIFEEKFNRLRIGNTKFENFEINNLKNPKESEINIGEIEADTFKIQNLRNHGTFKLYNLNHKKEKEKGNINLNNKKEEETINLNNNSFGKSEFQNLNFKSFQENEMFLNNFQETSFLDINWKYEIKAKTKKQERETYRQLKQVLAKQNNNIEALEFNRLEHEVYLKELSPTFSLKKKLNTIEFFDKFPIILYWLVIALIIIIILVSIFSPYFFKNFGENLEIIFLVLKRCIIFGIIIIFFTPLILNFLNLISNIFTKKLIENNISHFILFFEKTVSNFGLNPGKGIMVLISFNFIITFVIGSLFGNYGFLELLFPFKVDLEDFKFLHFVSLIINSALIYEIIKSFRKYSRKL
jgi:hypothetical protein